MGRLSFSREVSFDAELCICGRVQETPTKSRHLFLDISRSVKFSIWPQRAWLVLTPLKLVSTRSGCHRFSNQPCMGKVFQGRLIPSDERTERTGCTLKDKVRAGHEHIEIFRKSCSGDIGRSKDEADAHQGGDAECGVECALEAFVTCKGEYTNGRLEHGVIWRAKHS